MKLRNFANKFLLVIVLALCCCAPSFPADTPFVVSVAATDTGTATTKTYYLDQFNDNAPTGESLYDALGITVYHDYLTALAETQNLPEVVIAMVDTGVDATQPIFGGRILTEYAMDFSQGVNNYGLPNSMDWYEDENGHGTHVAGIIADATLNNVKILPIRIFYGLDNQSGNFAFENAVRYLAALKTGDEVYLLNSSGLEAKKTAYNTEHVKLNLVAVNLSIGSTGYDVNDSSAMNQYEKDKYGYWKGGYFYTGYQNSINQLLQADILPIVAAGNVGTKADGTKEDSSISYYSLPGACDGVLAVAAYDNTYNEDGLYWSAGFSYHNNYVSVSAPGADIWSACSQDIQNLALSRYPSREYTDENGKYYEYHYGLNTVWYIRQDADGNYYLRESGTSMATPFVAACYALLMSDPAKTSAEDFGLPAWDADEADAGYMTVAHKALLAAAATYGDQAETGYDEYFGYGTIALHPFAQTKVTDPLIAIENKIPTSTSGNTGNHRQSSNDETEWMTVVFVLLLGGILVWGFGLLSAYFNRRKNDDSSEA